MWIYNLGWYSMIFGIVYLTVPLYRLFCRSIGLEGNVEQKDYSELSREKLKLMTRKLQIEFQSEVDPEMNWEFNPMQETLEIHPGETALAFYEVHNKSPKPIIGVATYTVFPEYASNYFSKIQCFCFNQQMVNSYEKLELPLYFYIEPEYMDDRRLENIDTIKIIYRFFPCKKQHLATLMLEQNIKEMK